MQTSDDTTSKGITTGKRAREDGDEGDQDEHLESLLISECLVEEDFQATLLRGLADMANIDCLKSPAALRHAHGFS